MSAAASGQTICLGSGSYGSWSGVSKAITLTAAPGATPTMTVEFASGADGFTLDGIGGLGGEIDAGASNITIRNSAFTDAIAINSPTNANITFDHDSFVNINNTGCNGQPARIHLEYTPSPASTPSGVTVENSLFSGGDTDGIQTGAPMVIRDNTFTNLRSPGSDCNHTDSVQLYGGTDVVATGNLFVNDYDGIVAFDGTGGNLITDNACSQIDRGACVTLYSDSGSVVEHNTAAAGIRALEADRKSADPAGSGTVFQDNVCEASVSDGSTLAVDSHNLYSGAQAPDINGSPVFQGGSGWSGYLLASGSPGVGAATDGSDIGIRGTAGGPPSS